MNPVLTALYFIFGQIKSPQAKSNRFAFSTVVAFFIVGFFINFPGITHLWMQPFLGRNVNKNTGFYFNANLSAIKSSNNTGTSSYSNSSSNDRLACRNVAIFCENDHVLLQRIGNILRDLVEEIPNVETVDYYNSELLPPEPKLSPDIFIRLKLNHIKENIWPYDLKLQAEIQSTISNTAVPGGGGYKNNRTPPIINYNLEAKITHKSETTGYESKRYNMAAKDIAEQISKELTKNLKKWQEKHGLLPELPEDFYGKYKPNELPEPLKLSGVKKLYSYNGFMKHNETVWQLDVTGDFVEQLKQIQQQMIELGWMGIDSNFDERVLELRMKKENRQLHIFKRREDSSSKRTVLISNSQNEDKKISTRLCIRDVELLRDEELYLAIDKLFEEPIDIELITLFERMHNSQQREKYFELLKSQPPSSLYSQVRLAEMYEGRKMFEESKRTLLRAAAMLLAIRDQNNLKDRLKKLAKKLGDEKLVDQKPDKELLLDMGYIEIKKDTQPFEIIVDPDEPVILFSEDIEGAIQTLCLICTRSEKSSNPLNPFSLSYTHRKDGGTGWGTQGGSAGNKGWEIFHSEPEFLDDLSLRCRVTSDKNRQRYFMYFEIIKHR